MISRPTCPTSSARWGAPNSLKIKAVPNLPNLPNLYARVGKSELASGEAGRLVGAGAHLCAEITLTFKKGWAGWAKPIKSMTCTRPTSKLRWGRLGAGQNPAGLRADLAVREVRRAP